MTAGSRGGLAVTLATPYRAGPVAVVLAQGEPGRLTSLLAAVTGRADWPIGRACLADLAGVDRGVVVRLGPALAELMPHGGVRVVQRLLDAAAAAGAVLDADPPAEAVYPEAGSGVGADALAAVARAASPAAVDPLLAQPALWGKALRGGALPTPGSGAAESLVARAVSWSRLIEPATVVVVGAPNVGKSTLTNRLLGQAVSVVADLPGTTRDWVGQAAELVTPREPAGVAVRWVDTPGLRSAGADPVERRAIDAARAVIAGASVVVAMRDAASPWPAPESVGRGVDLWVLGKCDAGPFGGAGDRAADPLRLSAKRGEGLGSLQDAVLSKLGVADRPTGALWAFSPMLRGWLLSGGELAGYLGVARRG